MSKHLNIGLPVETAVWLTGTETRHQLEQWRRDCEAELGRLALEQGITLTPVTWTEKHPGEDRVPPVPDNLSGPAVRLLVCEARVAGEAKATIIQAPGFVADLDKRDLARLRKVTREAHANIWPAAPILTDAECDDVIERMGPDSALKTLRSGVDSNAIH